MTFRSFARALFASLGVLALSSSAFAYRPFDGTDADVAELHEVEIEAGPVGYLQRASRKQLVLPHVVFNYGFAPSWELVLEGAHERTLGDSAGEPRSSLTDASLSAKKILRHGSLQEQSGVSIATELSALLPSTVRGERAFGAQAALIISQRWEYAALHLNVAAELTREHDAGFVASLIAEGSNGWTVRPVAEVLAEHELVRGPFAASSVLSGLAGAIVTTSDALNFDAALRAALEDRARVYEGRAGFTWTFAP